MPRRRRHRYPSDLADAQWALIESLLPAPSVIGRREKHDRRDLVDAILYVVRNGCAWRALQSDYPPWQTVYYYFARWHDLGVTERVHDALRDQVRALERRDTEPTAGIIDSQSVKGADTVPAASRGFDMGKKVNGRRRFLVVDTLGLLLAVLVVPASTHDTAGGRQVLLDSYFAGRRLQLVFGDGMFAGTIVDWAADLLGMSIHVVRRPPGQKGFEVLPRRWVVERTLSWITAHRRHARDYERRPDHAETLIRWAMIGVMAQRIDRRAPAHRPGPRPLQKIT